MFSLIHMLRTTTIVENLLHIIYFGILNNSLTQPSVDSIVNVSYIFKEDESFFCPPLGCRMIHLVTMVAM